MSKQSLTPREHLVRKLVQRAFPQYVVDATLTTLHTYGGSSCPVVRYAFDKHRFVDVSRARIEWQKESPELIAEAIEARLRMLLHESSPAGR